MRCHVKYVIREVTEMSDILSIMSVTLTTHPFIFLFLDAGVTPEALQLQQNPALREHEDLVKAFLEKQIG